MPIWRLIVTWAENGYLDILANNKGWSKHVSGHPKWQALLASFPQFAAEFSPLERVKYPLPLPERYPIFMSIDEALKDDDTVFSLRRIEPKAPPTVGLSVPFAQFGGESSFGASVSPFGASTFSLSGPGSFSSAEPSSFQSRGGVFAPGSGPPVPFGAPLASAPNPFTSESKLETETIPNPFG